MADPQSAGFSQIETCRRLSLVKGPRALCGMQKRTSDGLGRGALQSGIMRRATLPIGS